MNKYNPTEIKTILKENIELREKIKRLELQRTNLYCYIVEEKEKRIKRLFEDAPIGLAVIDLNGNFINTNPCFCNMLGYTKEEILNLKVEDITVKEDYKREREILEKNLHDESNSFHIEKRYHKKSGELIWVKIVFIIFSDKKGSKYFFGFIDNITDKKKKDIALKDSETKFKSIFNGINDFVFIHSFVPDRFGKIIEVNKLACRKYGYSREEFLNMTPSDIIYGEEKTDYQSKEFIKQITESGKARYERLNISKSGKIFPVEVNATTFVYNNQKVILSVARDISQRIEAENTLKENKRQLSTLIGNLPGIAYRCRNDKSWTMDFISDAITPITGHPVENLLHNKVLSFNEIIVPEDRQYVREKIDKAIANNEKFNVKYRITTKSGEIKWMWEQGCAIHNSDGSISHIEGYISDVTESKIKENELIKAKEKAEESDKLKSTFLATMSHELRTPLNGIIGFSELLDKETPAEQVEAFSKNILDCGNSLLAIIEDIFDLALLETSTLNVKTQNFKIFEIYLFNKTFIEDLIIKSGKQDDVELIYKPDKTIMDCFIESDKFKINQVLANLIKNAVKFTKKGSIEFGFFSENNKTITFYVKDTGIGISKKSQKLIFDIFRQAEENNTRNYGGTGIGLTISRMIAQALKGTLTVESEEGKGSTFYFKFPFTHSSDIQIYKKSESPEYDENLDMSDVKMLLVEDEEINLFLLESILEQYNPKIIRAENGLDAIIKYHENPDVNIILMDIKMPVMDGFEATAKIRETNPQVPIVALSAYNYNDKIDHGKKRGFNAFISKPFNKENLLKVIKDQVQKK